MIFRQAKTGAMQAFDFSKAKARLFGAEGHPKEKITFKDVAGLKETKEELKEIVDFLKNPKKYLQIGARIPRGVLLLGPPGTGKTLIARAMAGESNVPFFSISGSEFVEMFVGVGAGRVRDLFSTAKKAAPAIIFIDELDAIGRHRGAGLGGGHDEREQTLNQILVEMDGFERDTKLIVCAATNRPDILDPALLRPGRFDRRVILGLPDINDREEILRIHCRGKPLALNINLREVAERTPGFSGADLANLVNEAAILAARRNKHQVFQEEFLESTEKVLLGPERKSNILSKKEKEIAAFHEAGHALVSSSLSEAEPVRKISIMARGLAAGYTLKMPREERQIKTRTEFLAEMATLLGGYCAEKLKFGEITTGATNDLERASELARKLVKEYGMSSLGPISFGEKEGLVFLGKEISEQRNYSEKVAAQIDKEVSKFIKNAESQARKVLLKKKNLLDKVAKVLIIKETIEREEFEKLIGKEVEIKPKKPLIKKGKLIKVKIRRV
jgi:cell division protease FtsH